MSDAGYLSARNESTCTRRLRPRWPRARLAAALVILLSALVPAGGCGDKGVDVRDLERLIAELQYTGKGKANDHHDGDLPYAIRTAAAKDLGTIGDQRAVEPLVKALKQDSDWPVRSAAAEALGKIGDDSAVEPLVAALNDEKWAVRRAAALALGKIGGKKAVDPLINSLGDTDQDVRAAAAVALGQLGDRNAVEPLISILAEKTWHAPIAAAPALAEIGDERAVEPLIKALKDGPAHSRGPAAKALGKIGAESAVDPLIEALSDTNTGVRKAAARALAELGAGKAIPALSNALADWELGPGALEALEKLGWKPASPEDNVRANVAKRDKKALTEHWEATRSVLTSDAAAENRQKARNAIYAAVALGRDDLIDELVKALDGTMMVEVAETLVNCGNETLSEAGTKWLEEHERPDGIMRGGAGIKWGEM